MLARRRLARRAALTIATVGVVMSAGCHQGSSRGLAHQKLRAVTGIDLPPGATLCFAQGVETGLPRAGDCKPITSGERWRRAGRMQPYDKLPSESWLVNNSALERLRQTIAQHYLARPLRADGSIITTCTDWPFFADGHVHEDIYAPVTITDLTQVYRERAVDVAVAELQAAARQGGLPRRQRLEADFALRLHREIEQRGESSAKIVFIQTNWNGGAAAMARHPELARCIKDADPAAPVVTGVSGFVTYGITNEVSVFKASLLESALAITYGREYGDFVNQAAASIGLRWEHAIN
ncbi:MAG: hypothetical protein KC636_03150, partial [Myxococcales bacterium]|nr:hypothetical protein [Myxococcales bacterium]